MKASQIGCPVARITMARITAPKNTESRTATARTAPWFEVAGRAGARVAIARAARSRAPAPANDAHPEMTDRYLHGRSCEKTPRGRRICRSAGHPPEHYLVGAAFDELRRGCDVTRYSTRTQQELNNPSSRTIYRQRYMCRSGALSGISVQVTESPGSRLHRGCRRFEPGRAHAYPAGHRPKTSEAQDSWRRPFAKVLSSSTDDT
jgi:hypothetical protein